MDRASRWTGFAMLAVLVTLFGAGAALVDAPWSGRRALTIATAALARADYAGAVRALMPAVIANPRDAQAQYYLGMAYDGLGLRASARRHLDEAVRLAPGEADYEMGLASALLDDDRVDDALARLREALHRHPDSAAMHLLFAATLRRAGDPEAMRREYRTAARLAFGAPLGEIARQELRAADHGDAPSQGGSHVQTRPVQTRP